MRYAIALACIALPAHGQQVYRCPSATGQVVFQQAPCTGGQTVNAKPANVVEGKPEGDRIVRAQAERNTTARALAESGRVVGGMTEEEVYRAWGRPETVNTDVVRGKVYKQLVFRSEVYGTRYAYLEDGVVTSTQYRPGDRTGRTAEPCYSELQIKNVRTSATSITLGEKERREIVTRADAMKPCL